MDVLPAEEARWTVSFQGAGRGPGLSAVALAGADGPMLVTVATQGGDFSSSLVSLGEKQVVAKVVGYDPVSRLCFFRPVDVPGLKIPEWLAKVPPQPGAMLTARAGKTEIVGKTSGWVNRIGEKILPLALLKVDFGGTTPVAGTPLLDRAGKIAAVVFQRGEGDGVYAIPAEAVHRVAKDVRDQGRLVRGWLGVTLRVESERPRIVRVLQDSPAAEVGIREDDLISRIGARVVTNYADVANAFFYVTPGEPVDVEVKRGQNVLAFTLIPSRERPGN